MADYEIIGKDASYVTRDGEALIAKLMASKNKLELVEVQVGDGDMPEGKTPYDMTGANNYIVDAQIEGVTNPLDGQAAIGVQLTSIGFPEEGKDVTNLAVMAKDPDKGKICYCYVSLHLKPQWVRPERESINTLARFLIYFFVSGIPIVEAMIHPDVLLTFDQLEEYTVKIIWPKALEEAKYYVDYVHNLDIEAHPWLRKYLKSLEDQIAEILKMFGGQGSTNFFFDFTALTGLQLTRGVWNTAANRIEY